MRLGHPGGGNPKPPAFLQLDSSATSSAPAPKSRNSYTITLSFSFRIGNHRYSWLWTACTKDTESADGIGLPGHHRCGAAKVRAKIGYMG